MWQDLSAAFAFGQRQLGQGVAASEIIQVIQQVAGVTAVQLQGLAPTGQPPRAQARRCCARAGRSRRAGAQLLQLDPATQGQIGVWS